MNGERIRLHNEELHSLYRSSSIVGMIKSRRWRWAGHVTTRKEGRSAFKILTGKNLWESLGVDGRRAILEWILKKWVSIRKIRLIQLRIGIIGEPL